MDERQLENVIRSNLPEPCVKQFWGCVTSDEMSNVIINPKHHPVFIIANILPSTLIGEMGHWVCFYIKDKVIYFLDSFGIKPENYSIHFLDFLKNHAGFKVWRQNNPVQDQTSHNCGAYVLFFIHVICTQGIERLKTIFNRNLRHENPVVNDKSILKYVYKNFPILMPRCEFTFCMRGDSYRDCVFKYCRNLATGRRNPHPLGRR